MSLPRNAYESTHLAAAPHTTGSTTSQSAVQKWELFQNWITITRLPETQVIANI
jgi:hypothetical protein